VSRDRSDSGERVYAADERNGVGRARHEELPGVALSALIAKLDQPVTGSSDEEDLFKVPSVRGRTVPALERADHRQQSLADVRPTNEGDYLQRPGFAESRVKQSEGEVLYGVSWNYSFSPTNEALSIRCLTEFTTRPRQRTLGFGRDLWVSATSLRRGHGNDEIFAFLILVRRMRRSFCPCEFENSADSPTGKRAGCLSSFGRDA